ncbi:MAG: cell division protein FtsZ, partial [Calditrichaeota bacterium]
MSDYTMETDKELEAVLGSHKTRIRIVGTGGGGNNTVTRLLESGTKEVEVIAVNTDAQDLLFAKAHQKLLIGKNITNGLGAGSDPKKGEESAKESLPELEKALAGSDMVFITCGLGGGTGTGSAPVIAETAKKCGALTIAIVTLPFSDEGVVRWDNAHKGLEQLQKNVDTVIVVQNDRLLDLVPDMPLSAAFKVADEILVNAVKGITELVTEKGLVNLDFADVKTIMENGGLAMIGLGESESEKNAEEAAEKALQNPLLDVEITGARSALINISGGPDLSLKSAKTIMKLVAERLDPSARIIWGTRLDESLGSAIRVMLIVTCLKSHRRSASEVDIAIKKTAADRQGASPQKPAKPATAPPSADGSKKKGQKTQKNGSQVFSEIFMEESEADLVMLEEAIKNLSPGNQPHNEKYLRKMKTASTSLYNSSELFAYSRLAEFTDLVVQLTEGAIKQQFDLSENLIELFREIPAALNGMIVDDKKAYETADELKQKFHNVLDLVNNPAGSGNGDAPAQAPRAEVLSPVDEGTP